MPLIIIKLRKKTSADEPITKHRAEILVHKFGFGMPFVHYHILQNKKYESFSGIKSSQNIKTQDTKTHFGHRNNEMKARSIGKTNSH